MQEVYCCVRTNYLARGMDKIDKTVKKKKKKTDICINGTWNMLPEVSLSLTEVQHYRKPHWELTSKQQRGARPDVLVSSLLGVTVDKDFIL